MKELKWHVGGRVTLDYLKLAPYGGTAHFWISRGDEEMLTKFSIPSRVHYSDTFFPGMKEQCEEITEALNARIRKETGLEHAEVNWDGVFNGNDSPTWGGDRVYVPWKSELPSCKGELSFRPDDELQLLLTVLWDAVHTKVLAELYLIVTSMSVDISLEDDIITK